jgi:phage terminase large subunit-like protein
LEDWLNVKKLLENSNISQDILVNSISRDEVKISFNYINPNVSIEEACESAGIKIVKQAQGFYEINAISQ